MLGRSMPSCMAQLASVIHTPSATQTARSLFNLASTFGFGAPALLSDRALLQPGEVSPKLGVPVHIQLPPYAKTGFMPNWSEKTQIQDDMGKQKMRASGQLAARVLAFAGTLVKPGVRTDEIDQAVHQMVIDAGAYPSPLNYGAFPKSVCTSVNECVCHGIPDDRPLVEGDIVNVDVTVYLDGHHGDTSSMFFVGEVSPEAKKLADVTKMSLDEAIKICAPGVPYSKIGEVIHAIADEHKYGVVCEYVGHGVGKLFHSSPTIQHFRNNVPGVMKLWQTFTIEPMLVQGSPKNKMWSDNWTVVTQDGGLAAQYEHTLLITPDGADILTKVT